MDQRDSAKADFTGLTADIVSAYVSNNSVQAGDLPVLIGAVHGALTGLVAVKPAEPERPQPPVPVKKSITADYLVSLEDGKRYKSLKRHLATRGLTPEQYRTKWGLPVDYPMVAASYAKQRSELARSIGLGQSRRKVADGGMIVVPQPAAAEAGDGAKRARAAAAKAPAPKAPAPKGRRGAKGATSPTV